MQYVFWVLVGLLTAAATSVVALPQARHAGSRRGARATLAATAAIPLLALPLYALLGTPRAVGAQHSPAPQAAARRDAATAAAPVAALVDGLAARLQREPDDAGGWLLLARSYGFLGRDAEGRTAYARAVELGRSDAALARALGVATAAAGGGAVRGHVSLAESAAPLVTPDDTVFVFAQNADGGRMPIAALRRPARELPFDFVLTDEMAMTAGARLADFERVVVTARVSRSGRATEGLAGLDVVSAPLSPVSGERVDLVFASPADDRR